MTIKKRNDYKDMIHQLTTAMTPKKVASELGISVRTVYRWLAGETRIGLGAYLVLEEYFEKWKKSKRKI